MLHRPSKKQNVPIFSTLVLFLSLLGIAVLGKPTMLHARCLFAFTLVGVVGTLSSGTTFSQDDASRANDERAVLERFVSEFVRITPGRDAFPPFFEMGSASGVREQPVHRVTLRGDFSIAKYEVPQNVYEAVMGSNPSRWKGPRNSAEMMTWTEAREFCRRATLRLREARLIGPKEVMRLPSEAEWEYCCRAGTTTAYSFGEHAARPGDDGPQASLLDAYAWHTGNAAGNDPPVGVLKPNPWGLYDMHGYLWEYTADDWHDSYAGAPADGTAWTHETEKSPRIVLRSGSWKDAHPQLRSAARRPAPRDACDDAVGFRCVLAGEQ